ncbi:MAG: hypothetical protein ACREMX_17380, partial [Gemmatimonadales bacterium]
LSLLYFANSFGAAVGVLVAGFYLVDIAGLPGTLTTAAILNLAVAGATICVVVAARNREQPDSTVAGSAHPVPAVAGSAWRPGWLAPVLLAASFGTAVASLIYEIAWIRMLSLVLGSATHSFELMLSAFILGLALGAYWIRTRADGVQNPLLLLGTVQWIMGCLAIATLPIYVASFSWTASLMSVFGPTELGYGGFTMARYGLCLLVMLPATFCAGMTLPLLTRTLLGAGLGERMIGAVYGWNTLGSIVGATAAGLLLLPLIGLKALLVTGAAVDILIGAALLALAGQSGARVRRLVLAGGVATVAATVAIAVGTKLDRELMVSGVFRTGRLYPAGSWDMAFYRDGRTATVAAYSPPNQNGFTLSTNGKPDASLDSTWFRACSPERPARTLTGDAGTQSLLPLVALSHVPKATSAAVIGQGSGMSSHILLGSPGLREVVTVEIEPEMVAGSRVFYPVNRRVFDDPRSRLVIDDAKSHFASEHHRYDLILSEPSNPWVSGVSGLFTTEFYARMRRYLTDDGVFGQWLHMYELDDGLVLTVLAAIHQNFPSYEVYMVSAGDLLVVAGNRAPLPAPDWSVMELPAVKADLCHFRPLSREALENLHLVGRRELTPLLDSVRQPNSDYYPVLDLGAERRRYLKAYAGGFHGLSLDWFNLLASVSGRRTAPRSDRADALPESPRGQARTLGMQIREATSRPALDSTAPAAVRQARFRWDLWQASLAAQRAPADWRLWTQQLREVDQARNGGTAGVADEALYGIARRYLEQGRAPAAARDLVAFRHGIASWNFAEAADAGDRLMPSAMRDHAWITADELRDGMVMAKLHLGDAAGARQAFDTLARFTTRKPGDLRTRLLEAYVKTAEGRQAVATQAALRP